MLKLWSYFVSVDPPFCHFFLLSGEGDFLNFLGGDGECDACLLGLGGDLTVPRLWLGLSVFSHSPLAIGDLDRDLLCDLFLSGDLKREK